MFRQMLPHVECVEGRIPTEVEMFEYLGNRDLYVYCGHGSSEQYFKMDRLLKSTVKSSCLLIGCSSLKYKSYMSNANGLLPGWNLANALMIAGR